MYGQVPPPERRPDPGAAMTGRQIALMVLGIVAVLAFAAMVARLAGAF